MSTHVVTGITAAQAFDLAHAIRPASAVSGDEQAGWTFTFTPDLTAGEASTLTDTAAAYRTRNVELTTAEYAALRPDIEGLRTYHGIASPTAAQTAQATKAIIRVLRALLRD
jgi:hypothetical protein